MPWPPGRCTQLFPTTGPALGLPAEAEGTAQHKHLTLSKSLRQGVLCPLEEVVLQRLSSCTNLLVISEGAKVPHTERARAVPT